MLVIERTSDGRTVVRLHKDWHIGRMSSAYTPPKRNYTTRDAEWLQTSFFETRWAERAARLAVSKMERRLHPNHPPKEDSSSD